MTEPINLGTEEIIAVKLLKWRLSARQPASI